MNGMSKLCLYCGESYLKPEKYSDKRWSIRKYCSKACGTKHTQSHKLLDKNCYYCGVKMEKRDNQSPSHFNSMKYCSRKCTSIASKNGAFKKGKEHCNWAGGVFQRKNGYTHIRIGGRYVLEHIFLMENYLGRNIEKDECVHHCNENKTDNNLNNLELMLKPEHNRLHASGVKISEDTRALLVKIREGTNQKEKHQQWRVDITENLILEAMDKHKTQKKAAVALNISVGTLQNRMKYYSTKI